MKIQAINNNSFKGLFTDKSKQNNNEWLMEYRPYSWELDSNAKPKMALKEHLDIKADKLPDNEEIYSKAYGSEPERSKDILGTESYYRYPDHIMNGKMRSTITVAEPLNREESLKVYLEKMNKFRTQKEQEQKILGNFSFREIESKYRSFNSASADYEDAIIFKQDEKDRMSNATRGMYGAAEKLYRQANAYAKMTESLKQTDKTISDIKTELNTIETAKKEGKVIDISVRTGIDPDAPLKNYINNKTFDEANNENMLLILPAAVLLLKDIVGRFAYNSSFYKANQKAFADQIIHTVKSNIRNAIK